MNFIPEDFVEDFYDRDLAVVFKKTKEQFGGLSNMASGYPLLINDKQWRTTEALYQALRFPDRPDIQEEIRSKASPMAAKMSSKPHRQKLSRADWEEIRIDVMYWCLKVKLFQNSVKFSELLKSTGKFDIVEESKRDGFWGAIVTNSDSLKGKNVLGKLLMRLRGTIQYHDGQVERPTNDFRKIILLGDLVDSNLIIPDPGDGTLPF